MTETLLDASGLLCPLPVIQANRTLRQLAPGSRLRLLTTDQSSVADIRAYCQQTGHDLIGFSEESGVFSFSIRKRPETRELADSEGSERKGDRSPR